VNDDKQNLNLLLDRFQRRLPGVLARFVGWLRRPASRFVRFPMALFIFAGGFLGFLPVLGFWMIPLGLVLLAHDLPFLRQPMARLLAWIERKWPPRERGSEGGG